MLAQNGQDLFFLTCNYESNTTGYANKEKGQSNKKLGRNYKKLKPLAIQD
jgi:hypothetical protein